MTDDIGLSPLRAFLAEEDLEELARLAAAMDMSQLDMADLLAIETVLQDWDDVQALANLLMYPELMSREERISLLRKGLDDDRPYVRLAAMVGLQEQDPNRVGDDPRAEVVQRLIALIASTEGLTADRGSYVLGKYIRPFDCPDAVDLLDHPSPTVRRNVVQGIMSAIGAAGLVSLLVEPGFVAPSSQEPARARLAADGVLVDDTAQDVRQPMVLVYLPSLREWQESYDRGL